MDVVIVGAGAAGVGFGVVLRDLGLNRFVILKRDDVDASFEQWPEKMRFITPSFTGEAFGHLDSPGDLAGSFIGTFVPATGEALGR